MSAVADVVIVDSDVACGSVQGLVIDQTDHLVTHVPLAEGRLWGHKTVAMPISAAVDRTE